MVLQSDIDQGIIAHVPKVRATFIYQLIPVVISWWLNNSSPYFFFCTSLTIPFDIQGTPITECTIDLV